MLGWHDVSKTRSILYFSHVPASHPLAAGPEWAALFVEDGQDIVCQCSALHAYHDGTDGLVAAGGIRHSGTNFQDTI